MSNASSRAAIIATFAALLAAYGGAAASADWSIEPKIGVSAEYNDNHRLTNTPGQEIKVSGGSVDAQVGIRSETPTSSFLLAPRLISSFYPGDGPEETDDQYLYLSLGHKTQRTTMSLTADYSRRTTLGDYFPSAVVSQTDQLGNPDPGVNVSSFTGRNREDRLVITPRMTFRVKPRHFLDFGFQYLDLGYDIRVPGRDEDYTSISGSAGYRYALSETSSVNVRTSVGRYDPQNGVSTDNYGLSAGWQNRISETSEVYVNLGTNRTQVASAGATGEFDWKYGFTGGAGVRWAFQVTRVFLDLNRYIEPTSTGRVATRDQLRAVLTRRLSETTTAYVGARAIRDSGTGSKIAGEVSFRDTKYAAANLGLEWRFSRQFSLVGSYDYTWRDYRGAPTAAQSNAIGLGIVYEPKRL
jgi:opacity protein-like surface antigen